MMVSAMMGAPDHTGIALSWGLIVGAMVYAVGHVSGAHFNPAVTLAFAATNHFPWGRVPRYIAAQVLGGTLAITLLWLLFPEAATYGESLPRGGLSVWQGLAIEVLLTAILMYVISGVATDGRAMGNMAGLAVGATVGLSAMWAGPLTNASMNPARSLAPALYDADAMGVLWLYLVGPIVGALLGAFLYERTRRGDKPVKEAR